MFGGSLEGDSIPSIGINGYSLPPFGIHAHAFG